MQHATITTGMPDKELPYSFEGTHPKFRTPNTPGAFGKPRHRGKVSERRAPRRAINASKRLARSLRDTYGNIVTLQG